MSKYIKTNPYVTGNYSDTYDMTDFSDEKRSTIGRKAYEMLMSNKIVYALGNTEINVRYLTKESQAVNRKELEDVIFKK